MPTLWREWDQAPDVELTQPELIRMYERGFMGAKYDRAEEERWEQSVIDSGGCLSISDAAHANGWADSHAGQLVVPHLALAKQYGEDMFPGPAQGRGDCVSWETARACLFAMLGEVLSAEPDPISGYVETFPEVSREGAKQGVFSTEAIYWFRRHGGDGWQCSSAARVAQEEAGCVLRAPLEGTSYDFSRYSASTAGRYGRSLPPQDLQAKLDDNLVRQTSRATSFEEIRDAIGNGYGCGSCGGEGFSPNRDENGVLRRQGGWSHAIVFPCVDDRPVVHRKYGGPLIAMWQSWGNWGRGPLQIIDSALSLLPGMGWCRWKDVARRSWYLFSQTNGWPARTLPDYSPGF